jgi:molybdate transport system substrate-binding protein
MPTTRIMFGRVEMGVAVRANAKAPACANILEFKRSLLNAKSIAYSVEGTSGKTFEGVLHRLGIFEAVSDQLRPMAGGQTAISVSNGEAELGVIPVSTILEASGIALAGVFPSELQTGINLSGAVGTEAGYPSGARALLDFLTAPQADAVLSAKGIGRLRV